MRSAARTIYDVNQAGVQLVQSPGREIERPLGAHLVRGDKLVIKCLHLLDETRLIKRAAVCNNPDCLRHLQGSDLDVALADRQIRDVAIEQSAAEAGLQVLIVRNTA